MSDRVPRLTPAAAPAEVAAAVDACMLQVLPRKRARGPLRAQTSLFNELALDSMQVLQLLSLLEESVGRTISERELKERPLETVGDLQGLLARVLAR